MNLKGTTMSEYEQTKQNDVRRMTERQTGRSKRSNWTAANAREALGAWVSNP